MLSLEQLLTVSSALPADIRADGTVLVRWNVPGSLQLYLASPGGAEPVQLTSLEEPVDGRFVPGSGRILASVDTGGNERAQLYLTDPEPGAALEPLVVEPEFLHVSPRLSADGAWLAYSCNRRNGRDLDVFVRSLATGSERCVFSPGSYCEVAGFSPDGRWLGVLQLTERTGDNDLHLVDLEGDATFLVAPTSTTRSSVSRRGAAIRRRSSSRPTRGGTSPGSLAMTSRAVRGSTCCRTTGISIASPMRKDARSSCTRTSTATRASTSTTRRR